MYISLDSPKFQNAAIQFFIEGFKKRGLESKKQCGFKLLCLLFERFGFDFSFFCKKLSSLDQTRFLSYLLYGIYYHEIILSELPRNDSTAMECRLLGFLAEILEHAKMLDILKQCSLKKRLFILAQSCNFIRESSWIMIELLESLKDFEEQEKIWNSLIQGLRDQYYDPIFLNSFLTFNETYELSIVLQELENHAKQNVHQLMVILAEAPQVIRSLASLLEKVYPSDSQLDEKQFLSLFGNSLDAIYSFEELRSFFVLFGFKGYYFESIAEERTASLIEIFTKCIEILRNPSNRAPQDLNAALAFILSFFQQLYAFNRDRMQYAQGLNRLVYAVATRGSNLPRQAWLPSLVKGLHQLKRLGSSFIKNDPIIIFDQSSEKLLEKNRQFTHSLSKQYEINIWHLSRQDTVRLAKKLHLIHWIKGKPKGSFGFGGARNCIFLLAPVMNGAFQNGKNSFEELMKCSKKKLFAFFNCKVLGNSGEDAIIHIGEEDVAIFSANILQDALFAALHKDIYFQRQTYAFGRATHQIVPNVDAQSLLENPSVIFTSTHWSSHPVSSGMKGMITKPKFCLPISFGSEEGHVMCLRRLRDLFYKPVIHLAGTRLPRKFIPAFPLDGILDYLKTYLPYSIQVSLIDSLIDPFPVNREGRCILPWNDPGFLNNPLFHSLNELFEFVFREETIEELKNRFWNNFRYLVEGSKENLPIKKDVNALACKEDFSLLTTPLRSYYESVQRDAQLFFAYAQAAYLLHKSGIKMCAHLAKKEVEQRFKVSILKKPLTKSLFELVHFIENKFTTEKVFKKSERSTGSPINHFFKS